MSSQHEQIGEAYQKAPWGRTFEHGEPPAFVSRAKQPPKVRERMRAWGDRYLLALSEPAATGQCVEVDRKRGGLVSVNVEAPVWIGAFRNYYRFSEVVELAEEAAEEPEPQRVEELKPEAVAAGLEKQGLTPETVADVLRNLGVPEDEIPELINRGLGR